MLTYILRRIGLAGLMLFGLVCLTFVIANIAPSDPAALVISLNQAGLATTPGVDGEIVVATSDLRRVGEVALDAGLPIWELKRREADLETLFFQLTEGTNRNLGPGAAMPVDGTVTGGVA